MKCFKRSFLAALCCFFSLLFSISQSIPTHAIDLNPANLELVGWNANPCSRVAYTLGNRIDAFSDWNRYPTLRHGSNIGYLRVGGCGETMWAVKNSYVQLIITVYGASGSQIPSLLSLNKNGDFDPISYRITSSVDVPDGHFRTFEIIGKFIGVNTPSDFVIAGPSSTNSSPLFSVAPANPNRYYYIRVDSLTSWLPKGDGSVSVTNELKGVGDKISAISSTNSEISQKITNTFNMIHNENQQSLQQQRATTDAVNKQTEQQKSQHDQEKKEEKDRENKGNDQSSKLSSLFSFTAFNPFSGLFGLFTGSGCKPIPTIGKMLNNPDATYCPWFPDNVRSILTPVFGISSMMLIFGFFIRWLSGSNMDGTIKVVERY